MLGHMPSSKPFAAAVALLVVAAPALAGKPKAAANKAAPAPALAEPTALGRAKVAEEVIPLDAADEPRKFAEAYLQALAGKGDDRSRDTLLGGATLNARLETLANWKIVAREPGRSEEGDLADVHANVDRLDREARRALAAMMGGGPAADDPEGLGVEALDADAAQKLLAPTRALAKAFSASHPVLAYVLRVDKEVFWHPRNPARKLVADAGPTGRYRVDFHLFRVETVEGKARVWPLRVLRLRSDKLDTGWRILPASDWNAE